MNFAQIKAFHAVALTGSFSAAAKQLHLTQPAVSLQMQALQRGYSAALIYRRGSETVLTEDGKQLLAITRRLFSVISETDEFLQQIDSMEQGTLRLGADSPSHIINLAAKFHLLYPRIKITMKFGNTHEINTNILKHDIDVAILNQLEPHERLFSMPLFSSRLVVLVSKKNTWSKRKSIQLSELHGINLIRRERGSATRALIDKTLSEHSIEPNYAIEVDSREAVRESVAHDIGASLMQRSEIGSDPRIHTLALQDLNLSIDEYLVHLRERGNSRIISAFTQLVEDQ